MYENDLCSWDKQEQTKSCRKFPAVQTLTPQSLGQLELPWALEGTEQGKVVALIHLLFTTQFRNSSSCSIQVQHPGHYQATGMGVPAHLPPLLSGPAAQPPSYLAVLPKIPCPRSLVPFLDLPSYFVKYNILFFHLIFKSGNDIKHLVTN